MAAEFVREIGPEFTQDVGGHVDADLNTELADRGTRGAVVGIVNLEIATAAELPTSSE